MDAGQGKGMLKATFKEDFGLECQGTEEATDGSAGGGDVSLEPRELLAAAGAFVQDTKAFGEMLNSIFCLVSSMSQEEIFCS